MFGLVAWLEVCACNLGKAVVLAMKTFHFIKNPLFLLIGI